MPIRVAAIDLSAATVGMVFTIPFGQAAPPPTLAQQMRPLLAGPNTVKVYNESPVGFTATWPLNNQSFTIAAGQWPTIYPPPNETELRLVVAYILPNGTVNQFLADLFLPGEQVYETGALGNSPVNGGAIVANVTANFLQGVAQTESLTEVDDGFGNPLIGPTNGAGAGTGEFARDAGNVQRQITQVAAALGNEFTVLAGDGSGNQGTGHMANILLVGQVQAVNSIFTAGSFGVPAVVAQAKPAAITATTQQTIIDFTTAIDGMFIASLVARINNGVSGNNITAAVVFTEPLGSSVNTQPFQWMGGTTTTIPNGATSITNGTRGCMPLYVWAKAATHVQIIYRDPTNTPSDSVWATLAQIA